MTAAIITAISALVVALGNAIALIFHIQSNADASSKAV
jgi:hypothetical protein